MEKSEIAARVLDALEVVREVSWWRPSCTDADEKHSVCERVDRLLEDLLAELEGEDGDK